MSRPNDPHRPDDPDETPTRIGGAGGSGGGPAEDPTVPSMQKPSGSSAQPARPATPAPQKVNDPLIGKQLGGCKITALLGRGAMGAVYKARQIKLDRDVAIKVIRPEMMTDQRTLKRFEVEARTVGRFNSAHVVMVHDVGFEQGVHYLVMEFVQGKNLRDHVKLLAGGRLPAAEAIPLLRQACKGLEEAQRLGVIHRDIKPDNLMLTDRGVLKIADFGIAKPLQEDFSMTLTSELIGTPLYMSPEQCQGAADLDFRSDMYSLGATFYYLLTGEPPVRASSVYELIQTKTKLENLCLWKALAELDQNHPLSRVIERMTALDRKDRYESYEALLNDIVIVEAGGTVQRLAPKPEKKELPKLEPVKKSRGGVLIAAAALVAVLGGGLWWISQPTKPEERKEANGGGVTTPPANVRAELGELKTALELDGPKERLRERAKSLVATDARDVEDKNALVAAIEQGLAIDARLASVKAKTPASLEPPFEDLRAHFAAVTAAAKTETEPAPALRKWLDRRIAEVRAEDTLGAKAASRLAGAFTKWSGERRNAAGDKAKIAQLTEQLDLLEASRRTLMDLVPGVRASLDSDLPVDELVKARRNLTADTAVSADVDVSVELQKLRAELDANGPNASLARQASDLKPTKVEQVETQKQLIKAIGIATERKTFAEGAKTTSYPANPQLPFDEIAAYYDQLDRALEPLRDEQKNLPPWAETLRGSLRNESVLQQQVVTVLANAFTQWKAAAAAPSPDAAKVDAQLAALVAGKERAAKWFPGARAEFDRVVPATEIAAAKAQIAATGQRSEWIAKTRDLQRRIADVRTLADWRAATKLLADLDANTKAASAFAEDSDVRAALLGLDEARGRWAKADARCNDIAAKIAASDLSAAEAALRAPSMDPEAKEELRVLGECVLACRTAFRTLETELDVAKALQQLQAADASLRPIAALVPPANERLQNWMKGVEALQAATANMIAIPGGTVRGTRVDSFFLSCTEVSRGEFAKFRTELRAAIAGKEGAGRLAAIESRLPGVGLDEVALDELLALDVRDEPANLPAERLTWYAAAAFAAWRGQSLPRLEEWQLAAFGDDKDSKPYPWGTKWSDEPRHRNPDTANAVAVDEGAESWRSPRLHHLAGNMAEWLHADVADKNAALAGGRYSDRSRTVAEEQAKGQPLSAPKNDTVRGYGARTMLRLKSLTSLALPR